MDDYGGMEMRNWAYYDQPLKGDLRLHLMSSVATERGAPKPFLFSGGFLHRECVVPEPPDRMEFMHSDWINHRENKMVHMLPMNHCYSALPEADVSHGAHVLPLMQSSTLPPPKDEKISADQSYTLLPPKGDNISVVEDKTGRTKDVPLKKRSQSQAQAQAQTHPCKASKPKKPKKIAASKDENSGKTGPRGRNMRQSIDLVINGIGLDISSIPTPVCSCTGTPQQCYRWGAGGWQSACCTTNISVYPLPMSTKRRGARIAGRKMSQGAFKKVLENLAAEGYNLSNPIDLRPYWAKHGTNKFVTIR